jgi:MerR family regulatory protein
MLRWRSSWGWRISRLIVVLSKIRYYEAEGLIGAVDRKLNGYRQYSYRTNKYWN